ncbi:DoxX family protein [Sphingobacterium deserti]|nr:DoxX family protein [Sphingobacterium deserti]
MNNGAYPFFNIINKPLLYVMHDFTPWFAKNILQYNYDYSIVTNGSGDTSYDWITLLIIFVWAVIGTIIWSLADRNRRTYDACYYWLTTFTRYYIAFMLINYGVIKLCHAQMPPPGLNRLMEPLHEFSPMGLAWTYFGYSKSYNIFVGIVEILAGLLLFRKTMVLGALITMTVSINIMTTNYFFDVPVKIIATTLFTLSLFLLLPHSKALYKFFILGKSIRIKTSNRITFKKRWKNKMATGIKIAAIGIFAFQQVNSIFTRQKLIDHYYKKSPLYGIYLIESGDRKEGLTLNDWKYIVFEYEEYVTVRDEYYKKEKITPAIDAKAKTISLNNHTFNYSILDNGDIILSNKSSDLREDVKFIKQNPADFELMQQNFNWIQEYPRNR